MFVNDFEEIKQKIETDTQVKQWYESVLLACEAYLQKELPTVSTQGIDRQVDIASKLALAYKMTGEEKYKSRLWEAFKIYTAENLNRDQLVRSNTAVAFAIAYDWLYDDWTQEQKNHLRNIIDLLLDIYIADYNSNGPIFNGKRQTNFNQIVNGGIIAAALSVANDMPEKARKHWIKQ